MYKEDYIMRLIHEMIEAILRMLRKGDVTPGEEQEIEDALTKERYGALLELVKAGCIEEAENSLYDMLDSNDRNTLELAMLFYDYLNTLEDEFLIRSGFDREEIEEGVKSVCRMFGLAGLTDAFKIY